MNQPASITPPLRPHVVPPAPQDWLTTEEAAGKLGLNVKTLANMRSLGKGPCFYKMGGKVWYLGQDILAYQRRRRFIASGVRDEG